MTDLYDQRIDAWHDKLRNSSLAGFYVVDVAWVNRQKAQDARNADRLAAYKRKRAMFEIQRLGQEMENG